MLPESSGSCDVKTNYTIFWTIKTNPFLKLILDFMVSFSGVKAAFGGVIAAGGKILKLVIKEVGPMGS